MAVISNDLASIILFHRKQADLTRSELAKLAGVGKTVIYDIEHGKTTIRLTSLEKILHVLNISLDWRSPLRSAYGAAKQERSG